MGTRTLWRKLIEQPTSCMYQSTNSITAQATHSGHKMRARKLKEFGQVQTRDAACIRNKMLKMELPNKRNIGWPKRRYMDVLRVVVQVVGVTEEGAGDRRQEFSDVVTLSPCSAASLPHRITLCPWGYTVI